jgi:N6-adenosine-specific RNA methylase IME4
MRYPVLLVDWPWRYKNVKTGGSMTSGSFDAYKAAADGQATLHVDEAFRLCAPIQQVTAGSSVLLFWATKPLLLDALDVVRAWGYRYKTFIGWDKARYGLGFWFRGQEEILIVGLRGDVKAFRSGMRDVQLGGEDDWSIGLEDPGGLGALLKSEALIMEKRGAHSRKPDWQYDVADIACRALRGPCLELFARRSSMPRTMPIVDRTGLEWDGLEVHDALRIIAAATDRGWQFNLAGDPAGRQPDGHTVARQGETDVE